VAFLTPEQKNSLGPFLHIGIFLVAVCFGIAINTVFGGPKVPGISDFAAIVLGVVSALVIHKQLSK
jgi:putative flippase GtrA